MRAARPPWFFGDAAAGQTHDRIEPVYRIARLPSPADSATSRLAMADLGPRPRRGRPVFSLRAYTVEQVLEQRP